MSVTVRMNHVRAAKICAAGARRWFQRHELSWTDFLENGISSDIVIATGDPIAMKAVTMAQEEFDRGYQQ